jgi:hypothetical protein
MAERDFPEMLEVFGQVLGKLAPGADDAIARDRRHQIDPRRGAQR